MLQRRQRQRRQERDLSVEPEALAGTPSGGIERTEPAPREDQDDRQEQPRHDERRVDTPRMREKWRD